MKTWIKAAWTARREFILFVLVGALNSAITYGLYLLLLFLVRYPVAYTCSYLAGIFISYYLNARFVFRERLRLSSALRYPVVYVVQYLIGLTLLYLLVEVFRLNKQIAPLAVIVFSVPITFVLSRYVIRGRANQRR
jgi:putative flippase GtrA